MNLVWPPKALSNWSSPAFLSAFCAA